MRGNQNEKPRISEIRIRVKRGSVSRGITVLFIADIAIWASPEKYTYFIIFVNVTNVDVWNNNYGRLNNY